MPELFSNPHITAALYFSDQGHYIFKYKDHDQGTASKALRTKEVSAAFTLQDTDSGWIPAGVMRTGYNALGDWFVYYAAPCGMDIRIGKGKAFTIPLPATILLGINGKYHLFAMGGKVFDPKGKVYTAPFPNIYSDGRICWGTNQMPKVSLDYAAQAWELFFKSPFNGDLSNDKCKKYPKDVREFLKDIAGKTTLPVSAMCVRFETLDGLIDLFRKGKTE